MGFLKVWATDKGAIGYTSDGRAKSVSYKPNVLIGYLDTSLNNAISQWYNVSTNGGVIAFNGTTGIYIEKTATKTPPSYVWKYSKQDASDYKPTLFGVNGTDKKQVFTNEPKNKNSTLLPSSKESILALGLNGGNNGGNSSGISYGDGGPDGKDYTKYYIIGAIIVAFVIFK